MAAGSTGTGDAENREVLWSQVSLILGCVQTPVLGGLDSRWCTHQRTVGP